MTNNTNTMNPTTTATIAEISQLQPGNVVHCCGSVTALVIAVSEEKILLMRLLSIRPDFVVGTTPSIHNGNVVWTSGHYFTPFGDYSLADALNSATKAYERL